MPRRDAILAKLPPVLLALFMAYIGFLGVISTDFGRHWDEPKLLTSVQSSIKNGLFLPGWYNYPSLSYDVSMLVAAPLVVRQAVDSWRRWGTVQGFASDEFVAFFAESTFHLRLRSVFFLLAILSGVPVYLLARQLSGSAWIALFAGVTSISTWEWVYHARWIAPDGLLALFISWSVLCQYQILERESRKPRAFWVLASAIFAGLAIGSKYPGGIVLVPLVLAIALSHDRSQSISSTLRVLARALCVAAAVFVVTTPGVLLEPFRFLQDLGVVVAHYGRGHGPYSSGPGWDHFSKLSLYLASVLFSKDRFFAVAASALALLGAAFLVRTRVRTSIWFLSLPLLYILYMSSRRVLIVRNYMLLLPLLAVLAGLGLFAAASALKRRRSLIWLLGAAAVGLALYNVGVATKSALGIWRPHSTPVRSAIVERIASSPEIRFFLSPASRDALGAGSASRFRNIVEALSSADKLIYHSNEDGFSKLIAANVAGRYRTIWSRLEEVNWDFYPSWAGHHRVLEVSVDDPALGPLISEAVGARGSAG